MTTRQPPKFSITPRHLAILAILALFAVSGVSQYLADQAELAVPTADQKPPPSRQNPSTTTSAPIEIIPTTTETPRNTKTAESTDSSATSSRQVVVANQVIRDQSGRILFQGDIDLTATLARIDRGERHSHRNDGGTFRNLEQRLPKQPSGYYKEYVHPTPGVNGPGPQRVVLGQQGETYYTPDHYQTFQRISR